MDEIYTVWIIYTAPGHRVELKRVYLASRAENFPYMPEIWLLIVIGTE